MRALITAGGRATRLRPITYTINKHLIPLANKPMIFYAIEKLAEVGVKEIGISLNPGDREIQKACGDGSRWGVKLTYIEQTGGPLGIAHVVNNARPFLGDEPFIFYLGDNIILGSLKRFVEKFEQEKLNCVLALSKVKDPQRFGVPVLQDGRIVRVDEKPSQPQSDYAVTGIYVYDKSFFDAFAHIKPSSRGEYEISDIHTRLIEDGKAVGYEEITGWWKDTGKPEDLLEGNQLLLGEMAEGTRKEAVVDAAAVIQGKVSIGKGTVIGPRVLIRGPVAIGDGCTIENSYIGPYTSIGNDVSIRNTEVEHSVVFDGVDIDCSKRIVDSLIGMNATVSSLRATLPLGHKLVVGDHAHVEI